jgi:ABC-type polysaccharide/polyol phosphate transport system ATPase subunit
MNGSTQAAHQPDDVVIQLCGVTKEYFRHSEAGWRQLVPGAGGEPTHTDAFRALDDVSLTISRGEALGLVGRNGAGKSTLLRVIAGTVRPTCGQVEVRGRLAPALTLGVGFNDEFTGAENLFFAGSLLGLSRSDVQDRFDDIVDFSGIREFIDMPVRRYSSGMRSRLGVALVVSTDAEVVIIDEALSVGDWGFRQKALHRLREMHRRGTTVVMVSHDHWTLAQLCDRLVLLDKGRVVGEGPVAEVLHSYLGDAYVDDLPDRPTAPLAVLDRRDEDDSCRITEFAVAPREIDPGAPIQFRLSVQVERPLDAYFTLSLSSYGRVAFMEDAPSPEQRFDATGDWQVEGSIGAVPLAPGEYQLRAAVHRGAVRDAAERAPALDWRSDTFTVRGDISAMPGLMLEASFEVAAGP